MWYDWRRGACRDPIGESCFLVLSLRGVVGLSKRQSLSVSGKTVYCHVCSEGLSDRADLEPKWGREMRPHWLNGDLELRAVDRLPYRTLS